MVYQKKSRDDKHGYSLWLVGLKIKKEESNLEPNFDLNSKLDSDVKLVFCIWVEIKVWVQIHLGFMDLDPNLRVFVVLFRLLSFRACLCGAFLFRGLCSRPRKIGLCSRPRNIGIANLFQR